MNTKQAKNKIAAVGVAAALMVGFGASMAPAANAGPLSGDCVAGATYNAGNRTCEATRVDTTNYRYSQKMPVTVNWDVDQGSDAQTEAKRRPEAVGASSITNATRSFNASDTLVSYSASYAYPKVKVATPAGWTDNGTMWERTVIVSSAPIAEREDTSGESAAIQAVMGATTSAQASSLLATATSAHGGLTLQSSKDALAGSLSAAQNHVSDLQASELASSTESQKRSATNNAISAVMAETTYAEANVRLESARTAFNSLNATSKAALQASMNNAAAHVASLNTNEQGAAEAVIRAAFIQVVNATVLADAQAKLADAQALFDNAQSSVSARVDRAVIDAASAHVTALQVADLANKSAAVKLQATLDAITAVSAATTYAAASSALVSAEAAYGTLDANAKASVDSVMNAAKAHVAALAAAEAAASRGSGASGGSSAGSSASASGGSSAVSADRVVLSPREKINSLVKEILNIQTVSGSALNRLVIASAEMNALAKTNPAAIEANLRADIDAANKHVAKLMNVTDAQVGSTITVQSVLVGRGESKTSDVKHFTAVKKALTDSKGVVLVAISADKDWSKAKRASYQKKMVNAAKAAGLTADQIRVAKPRPVETVSLYALSPAA